MIDKLFGILTSIDNFYWGYMGVYIVVLGGMYLSINSKFHQFKILANFRSSIASIHDLSQDDRKIGLSPFRLYFASVGGMIGLGNVVAVTTSLLVGGPGALFWLWVAAIFGMLIKYSEVYLGIKYRIKDNNHSYSGGSIYYLQHAFKGKAVSIIAAFLLGIYGVEIYQFTVVTDNLTKLVSAVYPVDKFIVVVLLLVLVLYSSFGGIKRLANICSGVMPIFIISYVVICLIIICSNIQAVPSVLATVFTSAFTGHAPIGGFIGSTMLIAAQQGIAKAVYSGDIGIGYDSIIQSETRLTRPEKQANMAIFASATDALICTMSIMVVLITDAWTQLGVDQASECVSTALSSYVPNHSHYVDLFMSALIFVAGYTTIIAYLAVGVKCALYINPKYGYRLYFLYAACAFLVFSYFDQSKLMLIMSLSGGSLVLINMIGIFRLRKEIKFDCF